MSGSNGTSQVALSKPAELIQKLASLKQSDPAAFKKVANKVAEHFGQLAGAATGPESEGLARLASRFASASENGDLSAIMPSRTHAPAADIDCSGSGNESVAPPAPPAPLDAAAIALTFVGSLTSSPNNDASSDPVDTLTALKASSPATFKKVMNGVAERLEALGNLSEGADRENLTKLAASFANASQNGDMTAINALKPPAPPVVAPPPPPPPAAPEPVDAMATAFSLVDTATAASGASGSAYDKLTALKTSNQASFKKVMNGVAEQLEALGNLAEGDDRDNLRALAATFASASQNGDLSALKPASVEPPPAAPAPEAPAPPPPVDAMATASSLVDALTGGAAGNTFDKLTALKASNQAGFKQVMNRVAEQLESLGNLAEGDDRSALVGLAATFASSSQSGDLSALKPASTEPEAAPVPPPAAPATPEPVDALATAFSMVDALTSGVGNDSSATALQKLTTLKTTDQTQFKSVMNHVAEQLESLGNLSAGGDRERLVSLAATFASGAQNGDLSALQPPSAPAPEPTPPPALPPPPATPGNWKWGQASAAYRRQGPPPQSFQDAFTSALALVDSLTQPAAA